MSVENVKKYFELLAADPEFSQAICDAESTEEKLALVNQKGLDFTKEEFEQAIIDSLIELEKAVSDGKLEKAKLEMNDLDNVNAAGWLGGFIGIYPGAIIGMGKGIIKGSIDAVNHLKDKGVSAKSLLDAAEKYIDTCYDQGKQGVKEGYEFGDKYDIFNLLKGK